MTVPGKIVPGWKEKNKDGITIKESGGNRYRPKDDF